jgi:hypothetical protein
LFIKIVSLFGVRERSNGDGALAMILCKPAKQCQTHNKTAIEQILRDSGRAMMAAPKVTSNGYERNQELAPPVVQSSMKVVCTISI